VNKNLVTASALVLGLVLVPSFAYAGDGSNQDHDHSGIGTSQLEILGNSCKDSDLALHDGFQNENAVCVPIEFGEQSAFENNPTLLIVDAPRKVKIGEDIILKVSTRNLIRDRFLAAGDGGYYLESAFLNGDGLTRGHFHSGCRLLGNLDEAPAPFRLGNQFVATEDNGGSADPDVVQVVIPGFDKEGQAQCASWAGDGSHRIPMMSFANEIPAFDAVRVEIKGGK
jgi:hypothetical protein